MHKLFILFSLILFSCSTSKKSTIKLDKNISKLVFKTYETITKEGEKNLLVFADSLNKIMAKKYGVEENQLNSLPSPIMDMLEQSSPEKEMRFEIKNDTIWRLTLINDKIYGDIYRLDKNKPILYYHSKHDKSIMYRQVDLSNYFRKYEIKKYPKDQKNIKEFRCYKVVLEIEEKPDPEFNLSVGNRIFEMYVTEEIELPLYSFPNLNINGQSFFPLEIKTWEEKLPGLIGKTELISVETN